MVFVPVPAAQTPKVQAVELDGRWKFALFDVFTDLPVFCQSLWCCCCRWSTNQDLLHLASYWACAFFLMITLLAPRIVAFAFPATLHVVFDVLTFLAAVCFLALRRQEIKRQFGIESGGCWSVVTDFLVYFCCGCCAVAQEARQIDEAYRTGHGAGRALGLVSVIGKCMFN